MKPRPRQRPARLQVEITIDAGGWDGLENLESLAEGAARAALRACGRPDTGEISLLLTDDQRLRALNRRFRNKDAPTNVLSFAAASPTAGAGLQGARGDIALAFETIAGEAAGDGKTIADHLSHLIIHGTLHLVGYDHENAADGDAMEALEISALASLGIANPYLLPHCESEAQTNHDHER